LNIFSSIFFDFLCFSLIFFDRFYLIFFDFFRFYLIFFDFLRFYFIFFNFFKFLKLKKNGRFWVPKAEFSEKKHQGSVRYCREHLGIRSRPW